MHVREEGKLRDPGMAECRHMGGWIVPSQVPTLREGTSREGESFHRAGGGPEPQVEGRRAWQPQRVVPRAAARIA